MKKKEKNISESVSPEESVEQTVSQSITFLESRKNLNIILAILAVLFASVGGYFAYDSYIKEKNLEAQAEMFQAEYYFQQDSLSLALNGDGNNYGFLDIIDEYGKTPAANISNFYAGVCYLKLGDYEDAIKCLMDFNSDDYLIQSRAYSLLGSAYLELNDLENSIKYYKKAVDHNSNQYFSPDYLKKLAIAYEAVGDFRKAVDAYKEILEKYPNSPLNPEARKHKARVETLIVG